MQAGAQAHPSGQAGKATLAYDMRYAETMQFYGSQQATNQQNTNRSSASGEVVYTNGHEKKPLALTYSGGYLWSIQGSASGTGFFQHMLISQGWVERKWNLVLDDDISYLPQSPMSGFSGIPGVGGLPPSQGPPTQPILLLNTRSIENATEASFNRAVDFNKMAGLRGSFRILRFPDGNGLETNEVQIAPRFAWSLNHLSTASIEYVFARFTYPDSNLIMGTQTPMFGYARRWSRKVKTDLAIGPQWVGSSDSQVLPDSVDVAVSASVEYQARASTASLSYYRATTGGSGAGALTGEHNDDVTFQFAHPVGRDLTLSANASYGFTSGLLQTGETMSKVGGVQAERRLGSTITAFANYTFTQQTSTANLPANAIAGVSQVIGFGIGYAPRGGHTGRK
ncbi:MAG TPA: hypothetical protein VGL22_06835 [Terracidiphilus sp.]